MNHRLDNGRDLFCRNSSMIIYSKKQPLISLPEYKFIELQQFHLWLPQPLFKQKTSLKNHKILKIAHMHINSYIFEAR